MVSALTVRVRIRSRVFVICQARRLPQRPKGGNGERCKYSLPETLDFALNFANGVNRTGNIHAPGGDAASNADTMMSATFVSGTVPFSAVPMSATKSVRKRARSPDPAPAMPGIINPRIVLPAASEAGSQATLERVTALENQVCSLEGKVMELLVKLEEVSSCVSTTSTPRPQAAAGASPTISNITFEDLQAQHLADAPPPASVATTVRRATREWVLEGPKTPELPDASSPIQIATSEKVSEPKLSDASSPMQVTTRIKVEEPDTSHASSPMYVATRERVEEPETPHALSPMHVATSERVEEPETSPTLGHTVEHPEGYRPVNCSCVTSGSSETDAVLPRGANARGETDSL